MGFEAYDYDILDDFGQTDFKIDLFAEIEKAYDGQESVFDKISTDDVILAFFPCVRFEQQILLWFRGESKQQRKASDIDKLEMCLKLHKELGENYKLITMLSIVVLRKGLSMVFENPYSEQHYLTKYWCLKPAVIDKDRTLNGDYFKKPTQYWFIGLKPKHNLVFEAMEYVPKIQINNLWGTKHDDVVMRSKIHPQYANRFIRKYLIDGEPDNQVTGQLNIFDYLEGKENDNKRES